MRVIATGLLALLAFPFPFPLGFATVFRPIGFTLAEEVPLAPGKGAFIFDGTDLFAVTTFEGDLRFDFGTGFGLALLLTIGLGLKGISGLGFGLALLLTTGLGLKGISGFGFGVGLLLTIGVRFIAVKGDFLAL